MPGTRQLIALSPRSRRLACCNYSLPLRPLRPLRFYPIGNACAAGRIRIGNAEDTEDAEAGAGGCGLDPGGCLLSGVTYTGRPMKVKLTLEYDGAEFSGWQYQPGIATVQGELEKALRCYLQSLAKQQGAELSSVPRITGSGRTDAGVHARGQVASFAWPAGITFDGFRLVGALNGISPPGLCVLAAAEEGDLFDARRSAHTKCYSYQLLLRTAGDGLYRGRAWPVGKSLDIPQMIAAAAYFQGDHDFSSFRAADCDAQSTVRTVVLSQLTRGAEDSLVYTIQGKGFLKQMVRTIAGTLVEVGRGRLEAGQIPEIIAARDRNRAGPTAPACGLFLEWVKYS